jgi:hypothetical protein
MKKKREAEGGRKGTFVVDSAGSDRSDEDPKAKGPKGRVGLCI